MGEVTKTPWSPIGYITYKRTYSRLLDPEGSVDGPTEEFEDTINRVIEACDSQLNCGFTPEEEERLLEYFLGLKGSVAGRFLWQLGTDTVDRLGLSSLQNCAFVTVDSPIVPFTWTMDMLALGAGVGFNIQRKNVDKIPAVREWFQPPTKIEDAGADFIVPDSREGWVRLLAKILKSALLSDRPEKGTFTYSTQVVRSAGLPIKGFGGTSSGPNSLVKGMEKISQVLLKRRGRKLRPIDCLDIMNIIAEVIVAGNVRRSAMIAIGDPDDVEYLLSKRWDMGNIPSHRTMSNNSVVCNDLSELHDYYWDTYGTYNSGSAEPFGLINLNLSRVCGRLGESMYPDPKVQGYNPCAEQSLEPFESCCLAEVFLPNIESEEQLLDVCELLYRINKHSLMLKSHHPETEEVVHRNMRMGIGMTGILQSTDEQISWLNECYEYLREFDKEYSKKLGVNESIKLTTVKPSGTLSLLPGVTPGIHPGYARYMFRRIRVAAEHKLVEICRANGYPVEYLLRMDGSEDYTTVVITFPYAYPENTVLAEDMSAIDQLNEIRRMQTLWSDNSVSCTVYFRKEELPAIKAYLEKYYKTGHKTVSFLLHSEHGFKQAPFEAVSKEKYEELKNSTTMITSIESFMEMDDSSECSTGVCPIR